MTRYDVPWLSAAETAAAIKTKQVSPVEVIQAYLERIERLDGQLHAYITVMRDEALAAARQAEQTVLRGGALGRIRIPKPFLPPRRRRVACGVSEAAASACHDTMRGAKAPGGDSAKTSLPSGPA